MTYQVIARKWRPQTFEDVTGQEAITRTLRNGIEHERLHHAYLFSGARGVGKTTTARLLAKAVNCHRFDRPTPTPCAFTDPDACSSCREIAEGRSIDVLEIDAASNTGVDNVREAIINTVGTRPARDRYKVFIIDEVHMLSGAAFNALLKTLEEPPPRVLFIMATTEQHKVPDTILSRCQLFEFRTIAAVKIAARLRLIADAEKIKVSDEALREIARAGEGSMRDAQSAFDQVISFSDGAIGTEDVETALGIAGAEMLSRVMRAIATPAPADALAVVDDLVMRGHDLRNFCRDLLAHLRDLLVVKVAGEREMLADASDAERRELSAVSGEFSESDLVRFFHSLTETEKHLRESAHPRYQLEIGLVKLIEMRRLAPLAQIVERLGALEETLRTGQTSAGGNSGGASTPPGTSSPAGRSGGAGGSSSRSGSGSVGAASPNAPDAVSSFSNDTATSRAGETSQPEAHNDSTPAALPSASRPAVPHTPSFTSSPIAAAPPGLKLVPPATSRANQSAKFASQENATSPAADALFEMREASRFSYDAAGIASEDERNSQPVSASVTSAPFDTTGAAFAPSKQPASPAQASANKVGAPPATDTPREPQLNDSIGLIRKSLDERRKPFLAIALESARRAFIEGDVLHAEFAPDMKHLCDALSKPDNARHVREACREVLGREISLRAKVKTSNESEDGSASAVATMSDTGADEARVEQQRLHELAAGHPLVQEMFKTLGAEIVEVRRADDHAQ